jgi:hypothetical protein
MSKRLERLRLDDGEIEEADHLEDESSEEVISPSKKKNKGKVTAREVKQKFIEIMSDPELAGTEKVYLETMLEKAELLRGATEKNEAAKDKLNKEETINLVCSTLFILFNLLHFAQWDAQNLDVQRAMVCLSFIFLISFVGVQVRYFLETKIPKKTKKNTNEQIAKTSDEMIRIVDLLYGFSPDNRQFENDVLPEVRRLLEKENYNREVQNLPRYKHGWSDDFCKSYTSFHKGQ